MELTDRHRALMRELASGKTQRDACSIVGMSESRASIIINSELFQVELNRLRKRIEDDYIENEASKQSMPYHSQLLGEVQKSIGTIVSLRDNAKSEQVQQKSALEILDRAGVKTPKQAEVTAVLELGPGVEAMFKSALIELAKIKGVPE